MHEIYLAEKVIKQAEKVAKDNKFKKILDIRVAIPKKEHFTPGEFEKILKMQAEEALASKESKFTVTAENTDKVCIKDIKVK